MQSCKTLHDSEEPKKNSHENEFLLKNSSIRESTIGTENTITLFREPHQSK